VEQASCLVCPRLGDVGVLYREYQQTAALLLPGWWVVRRRVRRADEAR
jgi:hypothetical protein